MAARFLDIINWTDKEAELYERYIQRYEQAIFYTLVAAAVLVFAGGLTVVVDYQDTYVYGIWALAAGFILSVISMGLSSPVKTLRVIFRERTGGSTYDLRRYWSRFKTFGIFLNLLLVIVGAVLLVGILVRIGSLHMGTLPYTLVLRLAGLFLLLYSVALLYTQYLSLRTPVERPRLEGVENLLYILSLIAAVVMALAASVAATRALPTFGIKPTDGPFLVLASAGLSTLALYMGRRPPTVRILWTDEREYYRGLTYLSRRKNVMLPTVLAFALMFIVLLVMFVFGIGIVGLFQAVPTNQVLLGIFAFVIIAMVTAVSIAFLLSRSEDTAALYREKRSAESRQELAVMSVSVGLASIFLILSGLVYGGFGFLGLHRVNWLDLLAVALLGGFGPYGFYVHRGFRRRQSLEERFPDFLRDLAASNRAGLTLTSAVTISAKGEYGALSPEIEKMADQLSWNVPFFEALSRFAERVHTSLIQRSVSLINEASRSGGNVTDVILAAARDAREIKNLENERRTTMTLYTAVIYITFLVFLVSVGVLYGTFIPQLIKTTSAVAAGGLSGFGGFGFNVLSIDDYRTFYYLAALVQAVGNGFVAGLIENGRLLSGMRHAFFMTLITLVVFGLVL